MMRLLRPVHSVVPKVLLLTILVANASSFIVAPASHPHRVDVRSKQTTTTQLHGNTKQPPALFPPIQDISYGEESRQYRRTVFSHDDWRRHRSQNRFVKNLRSLTASGIYKNLARELFVVTGIATFLCVYNGLVGGGYMDFAGVQHAALISSPWLPVLGLPQAPFSLLSSSLSLLLVFRTSTSYQRWDEARKNWGLNINHTRNLNRLGNAYYDSKTVSPERRREDLRVLALNTWAFVRSMKRHLSPPDDDEEDFKKELYEKLPDPQAQRILDAAHRPNRALQDLSSAVENLNMHFLRKDEIHGAISIFEDTLGSSERLLTSPVPLFYSRHTSRFLISWVFLLPFALYDNFAYSWNHILLIPTSVVIALFSLGIDELATQLEEPFTILPMQGFCDKIYNWVTEISTFEPGDNGMEVVDAKREHAMSFPGADKA